MNIVFRHRRCVGLKKMSSRTALLLIFSLTVPIIMTAQSDSAQTSGLKDIRKNSFYVELLGNGAVYSINYDRIFPLKEKFALTARIGANEYHGSSTDELSFNFLGGLGILNGGPRSFLEAGVGFTYFTGEPDRLIIINFGYRFQGRKGLVLRGTPMIIINTQSGDVFGDGFWIGFSIGYAF